jgi:hypothetical protein
MPSNKPNGRKALGVEEPVSERRVRPDLTLTAGCEPTTHR